MRLGVREDGGLVIDRVAPVEWVMLRELPDIVANGRGLELDPFGEEVDEETDHESASLREDWRDYVEPELRGHFAGQVAVLAGDLDSAEMVDASDDPEILIGDDENEGRRGDEEARGWMRIVIPADHVEPWYGALNQARLALESSERLGPALDLIGDLADMDPRRRRLAVLFLFYGGLQEALLGRMLGMSEE